MNQIPNEAASDVLKPCPFCGTEGQVYDPRGRKIAWHVFCNECSCEGPVCLNGELVQTREQAIEAWNQRTTETNLRTVPLSEIDGSALAALMIAEKHIVHMAAWISKHNAGYSFEGLMEDKWIIDQALGDNSSVQVAATRKHDPFTLVEALREAEKALRNHACHGGDNVPCLRTIAQCKSECGEQAGDALLTVEAALAAWEASQ